MSEDKPKNCLRALEQIAAIWGDQKRLEVKRIPI